MATPKSELRCLMDQARAEPVELSDPESNTGFVLVRADVFQKMRDCWEESERDREEQQSWAKLARKARGQWAEENAY